MLKSIFFKKTTSNKCYILEYLDNNIPKSTRKKIIDQMHLLEEHGLKYGYVKIKGFLDDMHKIRLNDGNNNCRVYFYIFNNVVYYLYAYNKKTQKTAENIKIKIKNIKIELLEQIKSKKEYLFNFIDLNKI